MTDSPWRDRVVDRDPLQVSDWYEMIDDFLPVATLKSVVLIPRTARGSDLHVNVRTAVAASDLGLTSLDHVRDNYVDATQLRAPREPTAMDLLADVYRTGVSHLKATMHKLETEERRQPTPGELAASLALERLLPSFKSLHLLHRLGHRIDGDAIARMILEQVAWALKVHTLTDERAIAAVSSQNVIKELGRIEPRLKKWYGLLSETAHMGLEHQSDYVGRHDDRTTVVIRESTLEYSALTLLRLADTIAIAWEWTQAHFIPRLESVRIENGAVTADPGRPFIKTVHHHTDRVRQHLEERGTIS